MAEALVSYVYSLDNVGNRTVLTETLLAMQPISAGAYLENEGLVVLEAENGQVISSTTHAWLTATKQSGYTGTGYVQIGPDVDLRYTTGYTTTSPELQFQVAFATTGTYHVWVRGYAPNAAGDSLHLGLAPVASTATVQLAEGLTGFAPRQWRWSKKTTGGAVATLSVNEPGLYVLHIWAREDGVKLDRLLLTLDNGYQPAGFGPP